MLFTGLSADLIDRQVAIDLIDGESGDKAAGLPKRGELPAPIFPPALPRDWSAAALLDIGEAKHQARCLAGRTEASEVIAGTVLVNGDSKGAARQTKRERVRGRLEGRFA